MLCSRGLKIVLAGVSLFVLSLAAVTAKENLPSEKEKEYLAVWKEFVLQSQGIDEDYFNAHISSIETETTEWNKGVSFRVCYKCSVGWASDKACDSFLIKRKGEGAYLSKDEILAMPSGEGGLKFKSQAYISTAYTNPKKLRPVTSIIPRRQAEESLKKCHADMKPTHEGLNIDGKWVLHGFAVISDEKNQAKGGSVDLETGEVLECFDTACRIY